MGLERGMNEPAAIEAVRGAIASIPVAERSFHAIEVHLKRSGHPIGRTRIKRLVEEYNLLDTPAAPIAQLVHMSDYRTRDVVRTVKAADSLQALEDVAQGLLEMVREALPRIRIENASQLATVAGAGANLVKVVAATRETLAKLGEGRKADGTIAGDGNRFSAEEVFEIYGPGGEGWESM